MPVLIGDGILDAHHAGRDRRTDRAGLGMIVHIHRDQRRALGDAVALPDLDAERTEVGGDLRVKRRAAADDLLKSAAECRKNIAEQQAAGVKPDLPRTVGQLHQPAHGGFHTLFADLIPNLLVHRGEEQGHEHERRGAEGLEIAHAVAQRVVDGDLAAVVGGGK